MKLKNVSKVARGIPLPDEFYSLKPGAEVAVSQSDLDKMLQKGRFKVLVDVGTIKVLPGDAPAPEVKDERPEQKPEGVTGEGIEITHTGAGWYEVHVNGMKVTDKGVRKDDAERIAEDYR